MRDLDAADFAACRRLLDNGSRSFHAASLLLPRRVARPATCLYAFCRVADDLIDQGEPSESLPALHRRLDGIYAGRPADYPEDRALAWVVVTHRLPRLLLDRLLEGFAWDATGRRYEDLPALLDYAARAAGTVGAAMALLMGVRRPEVLARACDLGMAMQLTNIARDVGEDARAGRLYLPLAWLRGAGIDPARFVADPAPSDALADVVFRLLETAGRLYARADRGIAALPWDCRPGIAAARRLYAAIGEQVIGQGGDSVSTRAHVPGRRKLALLVGSVPALWRWAGPIDAPTLAAAQDLVLAASFAPSRRPPPSFGDRIAWAATLMAELESRQWERP